MLTKYLVFRGQPQSVWFKYISNDDYNAIRPNRQVDLRRLHDRMGVLREAGAQQSPEYKQLTQDTMKLEQEGYYRKKLVDLGEDENSDLASNLYKGFLLAKKAASNSALTFQVSRPHDHRTRVRLSRINARFFGKPVLDTHFAAIESSFSKVSDGLSTDGIVISDNCGRDRASGAPVEGIVKFKSATQLNANRDGMGKLPAQKNDLMSHYLEFGETNNIRIEFSLARSYSITQLARVILHEATHKFAFTADHAYEGRGLSELPAAQAVKNADSYAYAGMSVLLDRLVSKNDL